MTVREALFCIFVGAAVAYVLVRWAVPYIVESFFKAKWKYLYVNEQAKKKEEVEDGKSVRSKNDER